MNLISYRGPGMAGGLSSGLAQAWDEHAVAGEDWWHLRDTQVAVSNNTISNPVKLAELPSELVQSHYRYCNEFLWPIMHDLPEYAVYHLNDRIAYRQFINNFARCLSQYEAHPENCFIQDYQLALLPHFLGRQNGRKTGVFWHIPWPKRVPNQYLPDILEIAIGLLQADFLGFHTQEYADNFLHLVTKYLGYRCNYDQLVVYRSADAGAPVLNQCNYRQSSAAIKSTKLLVAPLGIDSGQWATMAEIQQRMLWGMHSSDIPLVLSVDRTDYTKGIIQRLQAIDEFFECFPQRRGRVTFFQICGRTRSGISAFDSYWSQCQQLAQKIRQRWSTDNWQPLIWEEHPVSTAELSALYRNAAVMLVTPIRDGLNLTAKEFVACQGDRPGVLVLSPGAGVFEELGPFSLSVQPHQPWQIAETIHEALDLTARQKAMRMNVMKLLVQRNSLASWWQRFAEHLSAEQAAPADKASQRYSLVS